MNALFRIVAFTGWLIAGCLITPSLAPAQEMAAEATSISRPIPYKSVVESISHDQKSIRIGKMKMRSLKITDATRILKNDGTAATLEELHPGADVRGSYRKLANGDLEAITIRLGTKPNPHP